MERIRHCSWLALAFAVVWVGGATIAQAAGAIAIGTCRFGFSYDYPDAAQAQQRALLECKDASCRIVRIYQNQCAAYAHEQAGPCGYYGWAVADEIGKAGDAAKAYCTQEGGRDCIVQASICDGK